MKLITVIFFLHCLGDYTVRLDKNTIEETKDRQYYILPKSSELYKETGKENSSGWDLSKVCGENEQIVSLTVNPALGSPLTVICSNNHSAIKRMKQK